ncbi:MAG: hypothetical protein HKO03_09050 [Acidimicrobiia bacterium]|nr:hypothetical protein [Acidimicrobiia bacterium]NNL27601.1 hypothetical protein [Acidimicrobiia bacterium]
MGYWLQDPGGEISAAVRDSIARISVLILSAALIDEQGGTFYQQGDVKSP